MDLAEARDSVGDDFDLRVAKSVDGERPEDTILSQTPSSGKAEKGSEISVTVVGRQVAQVPDVVGSESEAAAQELRDGGFEVQVNEQESSFDEEGMVMSQNPGGGEQIEAGSGVTITVGTGPSSVQVPNLFGTTRAEARSILEGTRPPVGHDEPGVQRPSRGGQHLLSRFRGRTEGRAGDGGQRHGQPGRRAGPGPRGLRPHRRGCASDPHRTPG